MHQFSDKSHPASLEKYFTRTTFVHRHSTRTSERNDYFLPHFSTTRLQRSIRFSGVKLWNSIPCKFKNLSLKKFILEIQIAFNKPVQLTSVQKNNFFFWVAVLTRRHKLSLHGFPVASLNYSYSNQ